MTTNDYKTNRYNVTPTKSYNYSAQLNYSEPLARATYLQLSYRFQYRFNKSERSTYDFSAPPYTYDYTGYRPEYRYWDGYLERLAGPLEGFRDPNLSRFSQYENYIHTADVTLRRVRVARPAPGRRYAWVFGAQKGTVQVGPDGLLTIPGLALSRTRTRLLVRPAP